MLKKFFLKMKPKTIAQGAEAIILLNKNIVTKNRISKGYRLEELDKKIIKRRTKAETKLLTKASEIIDAPKPFESEDFDKIKMPFIDGKKLSENLDLFSLIEQKRICEKIGESIAKIHDAGIIHGDLTTSNMILVENKKNLPAHSSQIDIKVNKKSQPKSYKNSLALTNSLAKKSCEADFKVTNCERSEPIVFFIDFGLGFHSSKIEDKAVDLHLLKQALEAKHFNHWEELWKIIEKKYKSKDFEKVLVQLGKVEKRGRYKS